MDTRKLASWLIHIFAVFMLALPLRIQGHPQCLDFRPPFTPVNGPLVFCSNYSDFTCCSTEKDADQLQLYNSILPRLTADAQVQCRGYLKEIICQRCSPYAAHLYDSESTGVEKPLPGLCRAYCNTVQQKCAEMFQYLTTDQNILSVINNQAEFCKRMSVTDVDYCYPDLLTNPVLNSQITYGTATTEGCLCLEEFARNLKNPVVLRSPRDGTGRIFIGQQTGIVHIYYENKTRIAEPFINISVLTTSRQGDERGFLGLTFHPNFTENSKLYIFYSVANNNKQYIRVSELRLMQNDSNKVDRDSEKIVIEVEQPYGNHNGGEVRFVVFSSPCGKKSDAVFRSFPSIPHSPHRGLTLYPNCPLPLQPLSYHLYNTATLPYQRNKADLSFITLRPVGMLPVTWGWAMAVFEYSSPPPPPPPPAPLFSSGLSQE